MLFRSVPFVGSRRPEAIFKSVDLPQPEGPTIVTNSPLLSSKVMFCSASVPSGKIIPMSSNDKDVEVLSPVSNFYLTRSHLSNLNLLKKHINTNVHLLRKQATQKQSSFYSY